jgi:drug/metabolite transporter (DMT)-like permease
MFWGFGNIAQKTVLDHVGPLAAVGLRCLIAAIAILPLVRLERPGGGDRRAWRRSILPVALLFAGALTLQQCAYLSTSVTNASFLVNTATVLTPVLAWLALRERPGRRVAVAAAATLAGAFLMSGVGAAGGLAALNRGDVACLASAALYAGWMVALGRHAQRHGRPFASAWVQFALAAAVALPAAGLAEPLPLAAIAEAWPSLAVLGLFSTAAAFGLQTYAQRFTRASTAAVLVSAESVFGALGAAAVLGERVPDAALAGAALILFSIVLVAGVGGSPTRPAPVAETLGV